MRRWHHLMRRWQSWLPWLAMIAALVGFANFFWFAVESSALGGDALNGMVRGGHYYVGSHGVLTEVSEAQWYWSRSHAISVFGTHLLALVGLGFLLFRVFFPAILPSPSPDDAERLVAARLPKYPLIMKVWIVGALMLSVVFLLTWATPGLNPTFLIGLAIVGFNAYWWLIRDRRRW
jgi:hypothetical protein